MPLPPHTLPGTGIKQVRGTKAAAATASWPYRGRGCCASSSLEGVWPGNPAPVPSRPRPASSLRPLLFSRFLTPSSLRALVSQPAAREYLASPVLSSPLRLAPRLPCLGGRTFHISPSDSPSQVTLALSLPVTVFYFSKAPVYLC